MELNNREWREANRKLLDVVMHVAPTEKEQQAFTSLVNETRWENFEDEEIVFKHLLNALSDGIRFGNWPSDV